MTRREQVSRLGAVVLTLSAAVGCVWLMRRGARAVVDRFGIGGQADYADALPDRRPAPRTYDLAKLVPPKLEFNIAGMELHSIGTTLDRPLELAIAQDEQLAAARGWERIEMPLAYALAREINGEHLYRTQNGDVKRWTYYEIAGNRTRREELTIPAVSCPILRDDDSFESIVGARSRELCEALPGVVREVMVGEVFHTRVLRRGDGTALHLATLNAFGAAVARGQVAAAFARAGWTLERNGELVYRRGNLMGFANTVPRDDGTGTLVLYRFSDDEALEEALTDGEDKKDIYLKGEKEK